MEDYIHSFNTVRPIKTKNNSDCICVRGIVIEGFHRGRKIGFRTGFYIFQIIFSFS